jgi:voltage-gated potassium channel
LQIISNELAGIISALSMLLALIIIASTATWLVEHEVQPNDFGSIPQAMWWASVILTTVGYGDVLAATLLGKISGIVITILVCRNCRFTSKYACKWFHY